MRILGIDLGQTSVKAVELDSSFGRYEIREYYEQKIEADADPAQAVVKLIEGLPKAPDRIAVAIGTHQVTFRTIRLPVKDKKAIQSNLAFELEDELPFPNDQTVYDYHYSAQSGPGTLVHVEATLKKYIQASLEQWSQAGMDPDLITTEAWAFRTYFNRILSGAPQDKPVLLVHIGHRKTLIYSHWKGAPVSCREVLWGGVDLTMAVCKKYGIPMEQAEQTKLDHGFVLPRSQRDQATAEQREFSRTMIEALQELFREIRQAELSCKATTLQTVGTIYLSGGSSLLPGLSRLMEEELMVAVQPIRALSSIAQSGVTYSEQTDATFTLPAALALCLVGSERSQAINFRKAAFQKMGKSREINVSNLRKPMIAIAAILLCLVGSTLFQSRFYQNKLTELDSQLEREITAFFGPIPKSVVKTYLASTSTLKASLNKELDKQRELARLMTPNPQSPLNFLKTLSQSVGKDMVVDMIRFQAGAAPEAQYAANPDNTTSLTFVVENAQTADRLAGAIESKVQSLQKTKLEEIVYPEGGGKKWKITFSGKPTEESYGK